MLILAFSLSSDLLFISLWKDFKLIKKTEKKNKKMHSENFFHHLRMILESCSLSLKEIDQIYTTGKPSNDTGLRVSSAFLSTLKTLKKDLKIYYIDTLIFQALEFKNCLSGLEIGKGEKINLLIKSEEKVIFNKICSKEELKEKKEENPKQVFLKNLEKVNFARNFKNNWKEFKLLKNIKELI